MTDPIFILTLSIIIIGPGAAIYLARLVMNNRDDGHNITFETRRMFFAGAVLIGIGFIFFEGMLLHYYGVSGNVGGKDIFDTCKTVLPPIVTLILGYYFGSTTNNHVSEEAKDDKTGKGQ